MYLSQIYQQRLSMYIYIFTNRNYINFRIKFYVSQYNSKYWNFFMTPWDYYIHWFKLVFDCLNSINWKDNINSRADFNEVFFGEVKITVCIVTYKNVKDFVLFIKRNLLVSCSNIYLIHNSYLYRQLAICFENRQIIF